MIWWVLCLENSPAGGKDVDDGAVVAEGRAGPGRVNGADGDSVGGRGGRVVGSVGIVIASSDDGEDTAGVGIVHGSVEGGRVSTAYVGAKGSQSGTLRESSVRGRSHSYQETC